MKIIEYLEKESINWFYINLKIDTNNNKLLCCHPLETIRPSMTDFINEKELVKTRQTNKYKTKYIAIDTNDVYQIDIDTKNENKEPYVPDAYMEVCKNNPYFLSSTKKLPHIFVKVNEKAKKNRYQIDEDIELLSGQWSFCEAEATVENDDKKIQEIDKSIYTKYEKPVKDKKNVQKKNSITVQEVNMDEIRQLIDNCISKSRADKYHDWIEIGMCLFNIDNDLNGECFKMWEEFSTASVKYEPGVCEKKWSSFRKQGGLNAGSLYYFAKNDNPFEWDEIISKRVSDDIKLFDASHNALARVIHKLFKDEFVCYSGWKVMVLL